MKESVRKRIKVLPTFKHDFWEQYFPAIEEKMKKQAEEKAQKEGIIQEINFNAIPTNPYPLRDGYKWCIINPMTKDIEEVYDFLADYYIVDVTERFRMKYPLELIKWALTPPGHFEDGAIGIRDKSDNSLVGFAAIVPTKATIGNVTVDISEANFLCMKLKLRSKRLAPTLMKETRRRSLRRQFSFSFYSSSKLIASPHCETWYYHRSLNFKKTLEVSSLLNFRLDWIVFQKVVQLKNRKRFIKYQKSLM